MKFDTDSFARFDHHSVQLADEVLSKTRFQGTLTEDDQVLEVGCGTGHFARRFLLSRSKPCRRIVATDFDPAMIDFAREHYSHEDIAYVILDIAASNMTPFLERHGTFDRVLCFWVFHLIQDQKAAYANIANLLKDHGECLVVAFSSLDTMDVWRDVYRTPKWKGRIPDPQNVFNASINYNRVKSASQVEAEVRDTLRGTGLHCISCDVRDSSWKFDSMQSLLEKQMSILPFKAFVPIEEWAAFRDLWQELLYRQLSPTQGRTVALKFTYYVVHARRSMD